MTHIYTQKQYASLAKTHATYVRASTPLGDIAEQGTAIVDPTGEYALMPGTGPRVPYLPAPPNHHWEAI